MAEQKEPQKETNSLLLAVEVIGLLLIFAGGLSLWEQFDEPDTLADPMDTNLDGKVDFWDIEDDIREALRNERNLTETGNGWWTD